MTIIMAFIRFLLQLVVSYPMRIAAICAGSAFFSEAVLNPFLNRFQNLEIHEKLRKINFLSCVRRNEHAEKILNNCVTSSGTQTSLKSEQNHGTADNELFDDKRGKNSDSDDSFYSARDEFDDYVIDPIIDPTNKDNLTPKEEVSNPSTQLKS
ncbi:hypothetical protein EDEG_01512 [Edhazardia aedis USNM 41457]|uniref:Uncharacterized protein n=1 Tax=Edhazardia aedis (strain USNM 41457) TaxID=1003232 RepID=J8ZX02_EDHAE|nr:hypothetical protein EDEG_01512 [Edhazardia aedis USNM 41457]|eukprot:EJW04203.1 hypothetical protein EDEG_01512 [Edhazardia aedis USNM 41457]